MWCIINMKIDENRILMNTPIDWLKNMGRDWQKRMVIDTILNMYEMSD